MHASTQTATRQSPRTFLLDMPLYLGFAATGVGVALPGVLLPSLLLRWHLSFEQGGRLFLLAWIGSSIGALLIRGSLRTTLALGSTGIAVGSFALAFCASRTSDIWMSLYGLGLGLAMTSITLIRRQTTRQTGTELVRLNLLWAIGAFACPSLAAHAAITGNIRPVLCTLALCFALLAIWTLFQPELTITGTTTKTPAPWSVFRHVPLSLLIMTTLITGIEASAGGWLATYAHRGGHPIAEMIAAPTCFWAGLLLSRTFWSVGNGWLPHSTTVRASLALMCAASALLIAGGGGALLLLASFCLGFGIGPTYPLLLAWALKFQPGGAVFFLAGVGSACLPWLTGLISAERHSLRVGLAVPLIATVVMLSIALLGPLASWSQEAPPS